jgi:hypothetical protein
MLYILRVGLLFLDDCPRLTPLLWGLVLFAKNYIITYSILQKYISYIRGGSTLEADGSFVPGLFEVLYWVAMIAMSLVLAAITVGLCVIGVKFMKDSRKGLGLGCIIFSLVAASMVTLMINMQFF